MGSTLGIVFRDRNPTTKFLGSLCRVLNINKDRPAKSHTLRVRVTHFK